MNSLNGKELKRGDWVIFPVGSDVLAGSIQQFYDRNQQVRVSGYQLNIDAKTVVLASDAYAAFNAPYAAKAAAEAAKAQERKGEEIAVAEAQEKARAIQQAEAQASEAAAQQSAAEAQARANAELIAKTVAAEVAKAIAGLKPASDFEQPKIQHSDPAPQTI